MGEKVDYILDGGPCQIGIESTIVSLVNTNPVIVRQGIITSQHLTKILKEPVYYQPKTKGLITPGSMSSHYAPTQPLLLLESALFLNKVKELIQQKVQFSAISFQQPPPLIPVQNWIKIEANPNIYAHHLFDYLRTLDKLNTHCIVVETPPENEPWFGVIDRLQRAAHKER